MRLIDADAMILEINELPYRVHGKVINLIAKQPTIEERKKGKWIPQDLNKTNGMASTAVYYYPKCSVCGHCANYTNFCPNCGADMRERREE